MEIKFRAWDNKSHGWVYFEIGQVFSDYALGVYHELCLRGAVFYQFTGLTDKNGKEIYVGDTTDAGEVVVYEDGVFGTTYENNRQGVSRLSTKRCNYLKVTGNIHEL